MPISYACQIAHWHQVPVAILAGERWHGISGGWADVRERENDCEQSVGSGRASTVAISVGTVPQPSMPRMPASTRSAPMPQRRSARPIPR